MGRAPEVTMPPDVLGPRRPITCALLVLTACRRGHTCGRICSCMYGSTPLMPSPVATKRHASQGNKPAYTHQVAWNAASDPQPGVKLH